MTAYRLSLTLLRVLPLLLVCLSAAACVPAAPATSTLAQTATSQNGALTVRYPDGWTVTTSPIQVRMANAPEILENPEQVPAGQVAIDILALPTETLDQMVLGAQMTLSAPPTATEVLDVYRFYATADGQASLGETTTLTIGTRSAARAAITTSGTEDAEVTVIDMGEGIFVAVSVVAGDGSLESFRSTITAISESIAYAAVPSAGTPTASG